MLENKNEKLWKLGNKKEERDENRIEDEQEGKDETTRTEKEGKE